MKTKRRSKKAVNPKVAAPAYGEPGLIFEYLPMAVLVEDCSVFAYLVKQLQDQKVKDIRRYLLLNPDLVIRSFQNIKILDSNIAALNLYQVRNHKELVAYFYKSVDNKKIVEALVDEFMAFVEGEKEFEAEFKFKAVQGKISDVLLRFSIPEGYEKSLSRVIVGMQDVTRRRQKEKLLRKMAQLDALTGLLNHHAISKRLEEELVRSKRYDVDLSCMMIDIDYFKGINDEFGHQKGDQVIRTAAELIKDSLRKSDLVGRYGGDEFFVILPETKPQNAKIAAARIQKAFAQRMLKYQRFISIKNTLSIGISGYPYKEVGDWKELVAQADKAMYSAKASGRDRIVLA